MSVRAVLSDNTRIVLFGSVAGIIVATVLFVTLRESNGSSTGSAPPAAWFSVDDGKTWFADDAAKIPPFEKDGKTALGCVVWTTRDAKTKWVSHLYRFSDEAKRRLASRGLNLRTTAGLPAATSGMEVKRPGTGAAGWVDDSDPAAASIKTPAPPDGSPDFSPLLP